MKSLVKWHDGRGFKYYMIFSTHLTNENMRRCGKWLDGRGSESIF